MPTLNTLKRRAARAAKVRGHVLGRFQTHRKDYSAFTRCKVCGMGVDVITRPLPNEIEIGGQAVALNCPRT
jgi:hypothetical protein